MKIIVGLGNPGRKYERTRHNAGFLAVDEIARDLRFDLTQEKYHACIGKGRIGEEDALLAKPQTFMNESGRSVGAILRYTYAKPADLIVVHDELDLPLGAVRVCAPSSNTSVPRTSSASGWGSGDPRRAATPLITF
jgi:PTH1 family peptidyl-tRNA hydrolase